MGEERQELIVNLSGDQKKVLGFASWTQVSISAVGIILGVIGFSVIQWLMKLGGAGLGSIVIFGGLVGIVIAAPFLYVAFKPIVDEQNNLLYYEYKQIMINRNFTTKEIGTYLNLQPPRHHVNSGSPHTVSKY
ncbi:hypothetical protein [Lactobacillus taiwanensis]|uniref:hypothetical protein n=1 Tax=Lactobacillus taiwanensis TaxID=508451 RepID=UPI00214BC81A|nr:hypothetical protein [Lactobacillus taiwanensis]MCR1903903.1 hypothetical protein [Lactobacillus taiwanensis]